MSGKENGIHFIDRPEYERLPRVNWSTLKLLDISAAHYRQALLTPWEDTDFKKLGRACHISTYEPEMFKARCVVWEGKVRRGNDWEAFVDRHPDDEILTVHQYETALAVGRAVRSCSMAQPYVSGGKGEVTVLWRHRDVDCKSRLDWVAECDALADLKTVNRLGGAAPEAFGWTSKNMKYATQAAFYRRAYQHATGKLLPYYLIAAETMAPFAVQVYRVTESQLADGEKHFEQLLEMYRGCRDRSHWPQYADEVLPLELPSAWGDEDGLVDELGLTPAIGFGT
jgi:hypothetical protein